MGQRGPVPKRSTQRRRRNDKTSVDTVEVPAPAEQVAAPEPSDEWHPIARDWFVSLGRSAQHKFMEPSDWAAARFVAEAMTRLLNADRLSAQLFAGVWSAMDGLLTSEGARRRVKLEVQRKTGADENEQPATVTRMDDYRDVLGG